MTTIPELALRLAVKAPRGGERLLFAPLDRTVAAGSVPLKAGQFLWLSADQDEQRELRIILKVGERYVTIAPVEHQHVSASMVYRPRQLRVARGHFRLLAD